MQQLCSLLLARIQLLEIARKFRDSNLQSSHLFLFPHGEEKIKDYNLRSLAGRESGGGGGMVLFSGKNI
jgi:hypothetical protein